MCRLLFVIGIISIFLTGCDGIKNRQYSYIGTMDLKHIFLNNNGKIIFTDHNFEVISYNDLHRNFENIRNNRFNNITYEINSNIFEMSTRFYDNKLLYIIKLKIINENLNQINEEVLIDRIDNSEEYLKINEIMEGNLNFVLTDNIFDLEEFTVNYWEKNKLENGYILTTKGSISITLENYREIKSFYILWDN